VEGASRWADEDGGNIDAADSHDEDIQADKSPMDEQRDDEPNIAPMEMAPKRLDMLQQCRDKDEIFEILKEIGSGTYGLVSKCASWLITGSPSEVQSIDV
jgi:hypothetical protein